MTKRRQNIWHDEFAIGYRGEVVHFSPLGREDGYDHAYGFAIEFKDGETMRYHTVYAGGDQREMEQPEEFVMRALAAHYGNRTQKEVAAEIPFSHLNDSFMRAAFYGDNAEFVTYGEFAFRQYAKEGEEEHLTETMLLQGWEVDAMFAEHWRNPLAFQSPNAPATSFSRELSMAWISQKEDRNAWWTYTPVNVRKPRLSWRTLADWEIPASDLLWRLEILLPVIEQWHLREALPHGVPTAYVDDWCEEELFSEIHNSENKHHYTLRVVETAAVCISALSHAQTKDDRFVELVRKAAKSDNLRIQTVAMRALQDLNEEKRETLERAIRLYESNSPAWRAMALSHIQRLWRWWAGKKPSRRTPQGVDDTVRAALTDPNWKIKKQAAQVVLENPDDWKDLIAEAEAFGAEYEKSDRSLYWYNTDPETHRAETTLWEAMRDTIQHA